MPNFLVNVDVAIRRINFDAVREVEHYFSRKLLVRLSIDTPEQLPVAKEKARAFLDWLENR